jgi:molecular chaperone GrpE
MKKEDIESEKNEEAILENTENTDMEDKADDEIEFEESNEEGEIDIRSTVKKLREKIKKLEAEKKEYLDLSQRMRADYMNLKKETDAHRISARSLANRGLIEDILPVLDAYDMAQANKEAWEKVDKNWRIGIEYIFNQLLGVLEKEGVTQFGAIGERFDPELHESMEHVPVTDEKDNDMVVQILQKGYRMGDTVLRHARVKTGEYTKEE